MKTLGVEYLNMGINPEALHRIATIASGGLDSLPHSGAVVTVLPVMGLSHKEGYKTIGVTTVIIPIITVTICVFIAMLLY